MPCNNYRRSYWGYDVVLQENETAYQIMVFRKDNNPYLDGQYISAMAGLASLVYRSFLDLDARPDVLFHPASAWEEMNDIVSKDTISTLVWDKWKKMLINDDSMDVMMARFDEMVQAELRAR